MADQNRQAIILSLSGIIPAILIGQRLTPWPWGMIIGVVLILVLGYLFNTVWRVNNRWLRALIVIAITVYGFSIMRAIHELILQHEPIFSNIGKLFAASGVVATVMIFFAIPAFLLYVLIDFILSKTIKNNSPEKSDKSA